MTESEWLACTDPTAMLRYLRRRISERQECLFACACIHRIWNLLEDEKSRAAVAVVERFADGLATDAELQAAHEVAEAASYRGGAHAATRAADAVAMAAAALPGEACRCAAMAAAYAGGARRESWRAARDHERVCQAELLREVIGNPFHERPDRRWPNHVVGLAEELYHEGSPELYPILADALEELGENELSVHCRQAGHVRGCWVVDTLLHQR